VAPLAHEATGSLSANRTGKQMSQKWSMWLRRIRYMLYQILKIRAERL
jgi:hypothetical protein